MVKKKKGGESDLSAFQHGMDVGVSETADLL